VLRCRLKGPALRSVAYLHTHPVLFIVPSQRIYIIHRDSRIYMGIYICVEIYMGYICVEERVSKAPPCGCAAYMWLCGIVCVVAGERESESERGRGRGGGGGRERNNPSSKPLDKHSTIRQNHSTSTEHQTKRSTLEARRYDNSIHPKSLSE
jgi:hypothetical protein